MDRVLTPIAIALLFIGYPPFHRLRSPKVVLVSKRLNSSLWQGASRWQPRGRKVFLLQTSYIPPFANRFAHNMKSTDQPVRFAISGEILSGNYALLATMPQRGRHPLRARITGEDEIRN